MKPFSLNFAFDAAVMLTWSDWHTEPRSNRYHYATRFARHLAVYFVQADGEEDAVRFEPVPNANITLVHVPARYDEAHARQLDEALKAHGVFRPLLWIYNTFFEDYIRLSRPRLRVYHATEDYVTPSEGLRATKSDVSGPLCRVLRSVDLLIAVSEGVAAAYRCRTAAITNIGAPPGRNPTFRRRMARVSQYSKGVSMSDWTTTC